MSIATGSATGRRRDRGSATAELAVALPVLVLLLVAGLAAVAAVGIQLRCVGAARDGALAAARGESGVDAARGAAPGGATVIVTNNAETVRVEVRAAVPLLPLTVSAQAVAALEPGVRGIPGVSS